MKKREKCLTDRQDGMAAIVVTIVMMLVISLIVLGFTQVIRREQRQTLDSQLSTQAFYAAESGVNVARSKLASYLSPPGPTEKTNCGADGVILPGDYNVGDGVKITCLLIDTALEDIRYDLQTMHSEVGLIEATSDITDLVINWQAGSNTSVSSGCTYINNPPRAIWAGNTASRCTQPLLRVDLVNIEDGTRASDWSSNQFTAFFYPSRLSGAPATSAVGYAAANTNGNRGLQQRVICNSTISGDKTHACMVKITGLGALTSKKFGIRVMSVYRDANLSISAKNTTTSLTLHNGQAIIDSTATAQDVSHRIQARVSLRGGLTFGLGSGSSPDFAIYSKDSLCKQYTVRTTTTTLNPPTGPSTSSSTKSFSGTPTDCRVRTGTTANPILGGW